MAASTNAPLDQTFPPFTDGFGWRVGVSILSLFGLLIFSLLYLAFWAAPYTAVQSAVVVLVAVLAFVAINGATWASWGIRHAHHAPPSLT